MHERRLDLIRDLTTRIPSRSRPELAEDFKRVGDDPLRILGEVSTESPFSPYVFKLVEE